jgi:hypothetical protein
MGVGTPYEEVVGWNVGQVGTCHLAWAVKPRPSAVVYEQNHCAVAYEIYVEGEAIPLFQDLIDSHPPSPRRHHHCLCF